MVRKIFRTLRGALGTAVASAAGWVVGTTALLLVLDFFFPSLISSWTVLVSVARIAGVLGFVSGGLFSLVERHDYMQSTSIRVFRQERPVGRVLLESKRLEFA